MNAVARSPPLVADHVDLDEPRPSVVPFRTRPDRIESFSNDPGLVRDRARTSIWPGPARAGGPSWPPTSPGTELRTGQKGVPVQFVVTAAARLAATTSVPTRRARPRRRPASGPEPVAGQRVQGSIQPRIGHPDFPSKQHRDRPGPARTPERQCVSAASTFGPGCATPSAEFDVNNHPCGAITRAKGLTLQEEGN